MQLDNEYRAISERAAIVDRSYRALLEVTGSDRATWLHNLTTNQVKNLGRGEGNYAFALNSQGRILFDVNMLVRAESIWLDLDRRFLETAKKHFSKYAITEDVTVVDRSEEFVRFGLVGPGAVTLLTELGAPNAEVLPTLGLSQIEWRGAVIPLLHHDFCGPFAVELFVSADCAVEFRNSLVDLHHAIPVGDDAVQVHRIEAGIPWPGHEITDEYLPAETRQLARAVNYQKGCYLGQEVVERMRSRQVVARQLVGLRLDGVTVPPVPSELLDENRKPVGRVTSACRSIAQACVIGLGYVKTSSSATGTVLRLAWDGGAAGVVVADLLFTSRAAN